MWCLVLIQESDIGSGAGLKLRDWNVIVGLARACSVELVLCTATARIVVLRRIARLSIIPAPRKVAILPPPRRRIFVSASGRIRS